MTLILVAAVGAILGFVGLARFLPARFRERMQVGWRPWVWVPGGLAIIFYDTAMVGTWAGAAHGDGWCLFERPGVDWNKVDVQIEEKRLPPFITCVYSDGVRIDARGRE